jgi:hypothetical protein
MGSGPGLDRCRGWTP